MKHVGVQQAVLAVNPRTVYWERGSRREIKTGSNTEIGKLGCVQMLLTGVLVEMKQMG